MKGLNDAGDGRICDSCQRPLRTDGSCPKCEAAGILADDFSQAEIPEDGTTVETIDVGFRSEKPGDIVGSFKLIEKIGEGGFGVVWQAKQLEPVRRTVALKILKAGMDTREVVARFEAERQALALMDHSGIAKVYEAGATGGGRPFFAMELVSGEPITEFCKSQNIPTRERLELFVTVCAAVQHAHQKGIIHRDIKPSNILVAYGEQGQPVSKIIDFGVAKATQLSLTEKTLHTRIGQFVGTPAYMSPEQAGVGPLDIDTRTDIYGLGVLLYELLSGRPPFEPETLMEVGYEEMLRILREKEPPRPSQRLSTLGGEEQATLARAHGMDIVRLGRMIRGDLDWIVMKAMEKGRGRRYETASAMGEDVSRYLANEPVVARPPSMLYLFGKYTRRHRTALISASIMLLLLIGGMVASWTQAARAKRSAEAEVVARKVADQNAQEAAEQTERAVKAMGLARTEEGKAWLERAEVNRENPGSDFLVAMMSARAVGFEGVGRSEQSSKFHETYPVLLERKTSAYAEAKEQLVHYTGENSPIWTSPVSKHHSGWVDGLRNSRDGKTLASWGGGTLVLWNLDTKAATKTFIIGIGEAGLSPDFEQIAIEGNDSEIRILNVATDEVIKVLRHPEWDLQSIVFSPDGKRLATGGASGTLLWDLQGDESPVRLEGNEATGGDVTALQFSADSTILATGNNKGKIRLWSVDSGALKHEFRYSSNLNYRGVDIIKFRGGGGLVSLEKSEICLWDLSDTDQPKWRFNAEELVEDMQISPDGMTLTSVSYDGAIRNWRLDDGKEMPLVNNLKDDFRSLAFSADGKKIFSGNNYGHITIFDTKRPEDVSNNTSGQIQNKDSIWHLALSQDGKWYVKGGSGGVLLVWDYVTLIKGGEPITLKFDECKIDFSQGRYDPWRNQIAFNSERNLLAQSIGLSVLIWELDPLRKNPSPVSFIKECGEVESLAFSPNGEKLAIGTQNSIKLWNVSQETFSNPVVEGNEDSRSGSGLIFSACGNYLIGGWGQDLLCWDLRTLAEPLTIVSDHSRGRSLSRLRKWVTAISPNGKLLAIGSEESIRLWDLDEVAELERVIFSGETIESLAFSPDGSILAAGGMNGTVGYWTMGKDRMPNVLSDQREVVLDLAFSADGMTLMTCTGNNATIWSLKGSNYIDAFNFDRSADNAIAFSPNGGHLIKISNNRVDIQDIFIPAYRRTAYFSEASTGSDLFIDRMSDISLFQTREDIRRQIEYCQKELIKIPGLEENEGNKNTCLLPIAPREMAVSPDKKKIAKFGSDSVRIAASIFGEKRDERVDEIKIWNLEGQEAPIILSSNSAFTCLAFSPDARTLATGDSECLIKLWDLESNGKSRIIGRTQSYASDLVFTPDGKKLISGERSGDIYGKDRGVVKSWDLVAGGEPEAISIEYNGDALGDYSGRLAISPDGSTIVSLVGNQVFVYSLAPRVPPNLADYLSAGYFAMNGSQLIWPKTCDSLDRELRFGFLNVPPNCQIDYIRNDALPEDFIGLYFRARNWNAVISTLPQLQDLDQVEGLSYALMIWLLFDFKKNHISDELAEIRLRQLTELVALKFRDSELFEQLRSAIDSGE